MICNLRQLLVGVSVLLGCLACCGLAKKCSKVCGEFEEQKGAEGLVRKNPGSRLKRSAGQRIVNGYLPPSRGFMALIHLLGEKNSMTCGGSLINNKFVLTAGHCVCIEGDKPPACRNGKIQYNPKEKVQVWLGVNGRNIDKIQHGDSMTFNAKKIIIHPNWKGSRMVVHRPDLALIELPKAVKFSKAGKYATMPICLPDPQKKYKMAGSSGYVTGWGRSVRTECYTDNNGPERNVRCRFPFFYAGSEHLNCLFEGTPSVHNSKCTQFREQKKKFNWDNGGFIELIYNRGQGRTRCYSPKSEFGFCGTCLLGKKPNEQGYCPPLLSKDEVYDDLEYQTRVKQGKNWGFCTAECENLGQEANEVTKELQETKLSILPDRHCKVFNTKTLSYDGKHELCAAMKHKFPKYKIFERKFKGRKGKQKQYLYKFRGAKTEKVHF